MNSRNTVQKSIVAEALVRLANHPTADDVYACVHESHPSISKATVYRVLNKLVEEGQALQVRINNGADRFDHRTFDHHHVRCSVCGRVDDVTLTLPGELNQTASSLSGYAIEGHALQFDGICPDCQHAN